MYQIAKHFGKGREQTRVWMKKNKYRMAGKFLLPSISEEQKGKRYRWCMEHEEDTKTIAVFEHYLCASFGISSMSCGGIENKLGGTGQVNCVSGAVCRD